MTTCPNIGKPIAKSPSPVGVIVLTTALFVGVGLVSHPQAYIDMGTGSYMLQMLTAGAFGAIFAAKSLWLKLRTRLKRTDGVER